MPGIRSVFLGNWIHDAISSAGSLLGALDALSRDANANVRVKKSSGVHGARYVHVSAAKKCSRKAPPHSWNDVAGMPRRAGYEPCWRRKPIATFTGSCDAGLPKKARGSSASRGSWKRSGAAKKNGSGMRRLGISARTRAGDPFVRPIRIPAAIGPAYRAERLPVERQDLVETAALGRAKYRANAPAPPRRLRCFGLGKIAGTRPFC